LRILFIHNLYGITSGEEVMIDRVMNLLQTSGHEVGTYFKNSIGIKNALIDKTKALSISLYSPKSRQEVSNIISRFKPDLVQIQNLYPLISPSILSTISSFELPVVMRLSNYRLICPNGLFLTHGEICERCRGGKEYWCVLRNCEESFSKSFGYALRNWVRKIVLLKKVFLQTRLTSSLT
jgi:hypothetical protein